MDTGGYWAGDEDAIEQVDDPMAQRYSILRPSALFAQRRVLRLSHELARGERWQNIWRQTSNPTRDARRIEAVDIDYGGNQWGGLEYNRFNGSSFIDGSEQCVGDSPLHPIRVRRHYGPDRWCSGGGLGATG